MPTVTIRNLDPDVLDRIRRIAKLRGVSMEQEIRTALETKYPSKDALACMVRERWKELPDTTAEEIQAWKAEGRP